MIKLLIHNRFASILMSALVLLAFIQVRGEISGEILLKSLLILLLGVAIDILCKRYHIIGKESHIPIFLVCVLSIFFFDLSVRLLVIEGLVSLIALSLPLGSALEEWKSEKYLIYFGILIGVAQLFDNGSVLLFIPLFVFFILTGARRPRAIAMSLMYFIMVVVAYIGVLFVIDDLGAASTLIPKIELNFSTLNNILYRGVLPFVAALVVVHLLLLSTYKFRYPNLMKNVSRALLAQALLCCLVILFTSDAKFSIYMIVPLAILLSVAFSYKEGKAIIPVSLSVLVLLCIFAVYLNNSSAII